jgi:lipopolysaccharide/colanic/teichoic acid biosynthesis glycosyltransferase
MRKSFEFDMSHPASRAWPDSRGKRCFDFLLSFLGVCVLSFPLVLTALAVLLTSKGPVLFRQQRVGKGGKLFTIFKFRTMCREAESMGPAVTKVGDKRLTKIGGFLRRCKLDELPQLFNVLRGDMSLVGPRPKVPQHMPDFLHFRPGITGAATIAFRNEERALCHVPETDLDFFQVHVMQPAKSALDRQYMYGATLRSDLRLIAQTVFGSKDHSALDRVLASHASLLSLQTAVREQPFEALSPRAMTAPMPQ